MFKRRPSKLPRVVTPQPRPGFTPFAGGLDTETPAWEVPPGRVRESLNYEAAVAGGYQDITGYERYDGRPSPSDASFTILDVTVTGSIVVGNTVTGATSGATGRVIATANYPDDPTQAYLVLTKVTGTFDETNENLTVAAVVQGNTDAAGYEDSAPTTELKAIYKNLAADVYRADIQVVPGEDAVWGVFMLNGTKYAIRNKSGGATAALHVESGTGWTEIDLGRQVAFTSGGATEIVEGNTITGAISGATAVVRRVQVTSGTWGAGTAAGWFTISGQTGTFQAENLNVGASLNLATIGGNSSAITLAPDGKLDWDTSNFANPASGQRVYAADGVNLGWEFDGTYFAFIRTGMTVDKPTHVIVHKRQLLFSFGGSVQNSAIGDPFDWTVVSGANEIATGEDVTGFQVLPGSEDKAALLIACRQKHYVLYGNDTSDWQLIEGKDQIGAYEWTLQTVSSTMFLDDRGITTFEAAQEFGNFSHSALSTNIKRVIAAKKPYAVDSMIVRDKNQYRLFFSDKTAIYVTMDGRKLMGMMPVTLEHQVSCTCSEEDGSGNEEVFFGADNGYVYQMERGTSFDGEPIAAYLELHYDHQRQIEVWKDYFAPVTVEGRGSGYAEFGLSYRLDYGSQKIFQPEQQIAEVPAASGAEWDSGLSWDTFVTYDDQSLVPTVGLDLRGEGRNIAWIIEKDGDYFEPLLLSGVHFRYLPRLAAKG